MVYPGPDDTPRVAEGAPSAAGGSLRCVTEHLIAPLDPAEAREVAVAHAVMQAATYATYASAGFTGQLFGYLDERIESLLEADRCLVAKSPRGNVIGLASVTDGPEWWERPDDPDFVAPAVSRILQTLFTMPETHGTGLGAALLDAVLPDGEPAYLWVMRENPRAQRFYAKHGFAPDGYTLRTDGWGDMDMIRMVRPRR